MKLRRLAPVDVELDEAVRYYAAIEPQLGQRVFREFEDALDRIVRFPEGWRQLTPKLRQCRLRSFPYVVIYTVHPAGIVVIALANTHRHPDYWKSRLPSA